MFLTEYRPTSPARRWEKRISTFYCKNIAQKKFKNKVNFKRVELKKVKRKRIFGTSTGVYKCSNYNTLYDGIHYVTNVFKVSYSNYLMASIAISGGVRKNQKLAYGYDIEVCHLKKKKCFRLISRGLQECLCSYTKFIRALKCFLYNRPVRIGGLLQRLPVLFVKFYDITNGCGIQQCASPLNCFYELSIQHGHP